MSAPIGPGDWVEFYRLWRGLTLSPHYAVELGGIYRVLELVPDMDNRDGTFEPGLRLYRTASQHEQVAYPVSCFRPIYRPKASLIESLKQPRTAVLKREMADG